VIQVVVFDMDDTLFPEHQFVQSGFRAVSEFISRECSIRGFFEQAWERFVAGDRGRIFNQVLEDLRFAQGDPHAIERLVQQSLEVYRSHAPEITLFEDASWALEYFSKRFPLALLSDGYLQTQKNKATALKLDPFFERFYFTDQWGRECWKPSRCAYRKVEEDFSVEGEACVYISDNPAKDFVAPNQLGWKSIWINRKAGEYHHAEMTENGAAQIEIQSLYELEEILK